MREHNWFRATGQLSSGVVEGFNTKEKLTARKAFGFRTYHALEVAPLWGRGQKKPRRLRGVSSGASGSLRVYIMSMSPMPPCPWRPGIFSSSFGVSATIASVVIMSPAIEAAFCKAVRATLVGSMIPILTMSP